MRDPFALDRAEMKVEQKPMLEAEVQEKSVALARRHHWWARKFSSPANRSVPDYIFARHNFVFFVEFKRNGVTEPTDAQAEEHQAMTDHGVTRVAVIDTVEKFTALLGQMETIAAREVQALR